MRVPQNQSAHNVVEGRIEGKILKTWNSMDVHRNDKQYSYNKKYPMQEM